MHVCKQSNVKIHLPPYSGPGSTSACKDQALGILGLGKPAHCQHQIPPSLNQKDFLFLILSFQDFPAIPIRSTIYLAKTSLACLFISSSIFSYIHLGAITFSMLCAILLKSGIFRLVFGQLHYKFL